MPIIRRAAKTLPHRIRTSNDAALAHYRLVMAQAPAPKRPVKVLMLHGFTQSGPSFHAKTRALEKNLTKAFPAGITLTYLTAPHRLAAADIPFPLPSQADSETGAAAPEIDAFAWWRARNTSRDAAAAKDSTVYEGLDEGLGSIAATLQAAGPFDGVVGFSQGACAAVLVASLLERDRAAAFESLPGSIPFPPCFAPPALVHPPLKFAVAYSGFMARGGDLYRAFYEPKVATPTLHFIGTLDAVVEESRSLALAACCEGTEEGSGRVVYHPGGHFLPSSQKACVGALIGFVKEVLHKADQEENGGEKEESVEDMDMPF